MHGLAANHPWSENTFSILNGHPYYQYALFKLSKSELGVNDFTNGPYVEQGGFAGLWALHCYCSIGIWIVG
jgi:hypothetical protein